MSWAVFTFDIEIKKMVQTLFVFNLGVAQKKYSLKVRKKSENKTIVVDVV